MKKMAFEVTKDMLISDVIAKDKGSAQVFFAMGMFCFDCPAARGETIEEASMVHGIDCSELIKNLNEYFSEKA